MTELSNQTFRNENNGISKPTVIHTVQRFEEADSIKDIVRQGRPTTATNPNKALDVMQSFVKNPRNSLWEVAQHDINLNKIVREIQFI